MHFVDLGELMDLLGMWLQGFWMASQVKGMHAGETAPDVLDKIVNLMAAHRAMRADGYSNIEHVENWLLELTSIVTYLWD